MSKEQLVKGLRMENKNKRMIQSFPCIIVHHQSPSLIQKAGKFNWKSSKNRRIAVYVHQLNWHVPLTLIITKQAIKKIYIVIMTIWLN